MKKERTLSKLEREWQALFQLWEDLPEDILLLPGAVGHWSTRNVMAHITTWEEEALKFLPVIVKDLPVPKYTRYGGIDGFNAQEQKRKQHYSLKKAKEELDIVHRHLIDYLKSVQADTFLTNKRFVKRIYYDAYGHYREHRKQVIDWRYKNKL